MKRAISITASFTRELVGRSEELYSEGLFKIVGKIFRALSSVIYSLLGFSILILIWYIISKTSADGLPTPIATFQVLWELIKDPFYDYGPNDKGIGLQLGSSLARVFTGFLLGSLIAIPVGLLMGANAFCKKIFYP